MDLIITVFVAIVTVLTAHIGCMKTDITDLIYKWFITKDVSRKDLWCTYVHLAVIILLINLIVLLLRLAIQEGGGSFYPTYITRTPLEWTTGAILSSFIFLLVACMLANDQYNFLLDRSYFFSKRYWRKWIKFYIFDVVMLIVTYVYQFYFYGWHLGFLDGH